MNSIFDFGFLILDFRLRLRFNRKSKIANRKSSALFFLRGIGLLVFRRFFFGVGFLVLGHVDQAELVVDEGLIALHVGDVQAARGVVLSQVQQQGGERLVPPAAKLVVVAFEVAVTVWVMAGELLVA